MTEFTSTTASELANEVNQELLEKYVEATRIIATKYKLDTLKVDATIASWLAMQIGENVDSEDEILTYLESYTHYMIGLAVHCFLEKKKRKGIN